MHFSGVLISISVPDVIIFESFCVFSVVSGHIAGSLFPYFPYCTNSIEIVVPRGQVNWRKSWSQPARWYVRKVPDSSAAMKRNQKEKVLLIYRTLVWKKKIQEKSLISREATHKKPLSIAYYAFWMSDPFQKKNGMWKDRIWK